METDSVDVVGVGAGPANLALLTALLDARDAGERVPNVVCCERAASFAWHDGLLLPGARVQVPFLKDLATQRNPRSRYTFTNYLFEQGRLEDFINLRELFVERTELADYFAWVASAAGSMIRWDHGVIDVAPDDDRLVVTTTSGTLRARALVVASGRVPWVPDGVALGAKVVHASALRSLALTDIRRALVIGGGQSAIESALWLLDRSDAAVELCHRGFTLAQLDDNPFVNEAFYARALEAYRALPGDGIERVMEDLARTNFGVADRATLDALFRHRYRGTRLTLTRSTELLGVTGTVATLRDQTHGATFDRSVDAIVLATGYRDVPPPFLERLAPLLVRTANGYAAGPDHRLEASPELRAPIFQHGTTAPRFGPSEPNLSTLAQRGGALLASLATCLA